MLLDAGASPRIRNSVGKTPLHFSVLGLGWICLWFFIAITNYNCWTVFIYTCIQNTVTDEDDPKCVEILAYHEDTDVNTEFFDEIVYCVPRSRNRKCYNTALHYAAFRRLSKCVEILLRAGANPNVRNHRGETPLHYAVQGSLRCYF